MNGQAPHIQNYTAPGNSGTKVYYWVYWVTSYFTVLTWILALLAAGLDSWAKVENEDEYVTLKPESVFCDEDGLFEGTDICSLYKAAYTFQYMATIAITFTPPVIVIVSFAPARITRWMGLALGIILAVFSVFELIAFSVGASFYSEVDDFYTTLYEDFFDDFIEDYINDDILDEYKTDVIIGPSLGLAVTAWIFGLAGTIIILTLRIKATTNQDGPCRRSFMPPEQQASVPPPAFTQSPIPATNGPPPAFPQSPIPATRGPPPAFTEDTV